LPRSALQDIDERFTAQICVPAAYGLAGELICEPVRQEATTMGRRAPTSGIGLGIAQRLAADGYFVVVHSRPSADAGRAR
jgi:hypothetical protein